MDENGIHFRVDEDNNPVAEITMFSEVKNGEDALRLGFCD